MRWRACAWNKPVVLKSRRVRWYEVQTTCASLGWRILCPWGRRCVPLPSTFPSLGSRNGVMLLLIVSWLKTVVPFENTKNMPKWVVAHSFSHFSHFISFTNDTSSQSACTRQLQPPFITMIKLPGSMPNLQCSTCSFHYTACFCSGSQHLGFVSSPICWVV